jgi:hypothetical protein
MKKWGILIAIGVVFLIGGYLGLSFYGARLIQPRLQKLLGPGFTLRKINVKLTHLSLEGVQYEGLYTRMRYLRIEEVKIYPAIFSLLKGPLRIRKFEILNPSFSFYRTKEGVFLGLWKGPEREGREEKKLPAGEAQQEREPSPLKIDRLRIERGSLDFEDRKPGEPPAQVKVREIDLEIKDIQYPYRSVHSPIELNGRMQGKTEKRGEIHTQGWIDLETMDMETSLNLREIDVKLFEPYYRRKVSAQIDSGYINMESKISVKEKVIDAPGRLEVSHLSIKEGEGAVFWIPATELTPLLKEKGGRIQVSFHMRGNIGDPKFNLQETFLTRIALSLLEALGLPAKKVREEANEKKSKKKKE